jgi:hypothetical protein
VSLISRGYSGELAVISNEYSMSKTNIAVIMIIELILLGLALKLGGL